MLGGNSLPLLHPFSLGVCCWELGDPFCDSLHPELARWFCCSWKQLGQKARTVVSFPVWVLSQRGVSVLQADLPREAGRSWVEPQKSHSFTFTVVTSPPRLKQRDHTPHFSMGEFQTVTCWVEDIVGLFLENIICHRKVPWKASDI